MTKKNELDDALGDFAKAIGYFQKATVKDAHWSLPLLAFGIAQIQAGDLAQNVEH